MFYAEDKILAQLFRIPPLPKRHRSSNQLFGFVLHNLQGCGTKLSPIEIGCGSTMPGSKSYTSKRWRTTILIFEIFLFAFILVLPQVALPDFTAHGGVSMCAAQARRFSLLTGVTLESEPPTTFAAISETIWNHSSAISLSAGSSRRALLCTLIC